MNERKYRVMIDDHIVAENMNIREATILVRALFEEYYNDHLMVIGIKEMELCEVCDDR